MRGGAEPGGPGERRGARRGPVAAGSGPLAWWGQRERVKVSREFTSFPELADDNDLPCNIF